MLREDNIIPEPVKLTRQRNKTYYLVEILI
jgi:hypothetical protein